MSLDKHPETLGDWREIAVEALGEDSAAVAFLDREIAKKGSCTKVAKHWSQMMHLLKRLHGSGQTNDPDLSASDGQ